jgi:hypothetical protein
MVAGVHSWASYFGMGEKKICWILLIYKQLNSMIHYLKNKLKRKDESIFPSRVLFILSFLTA